MTIPLDLQTSGTLLPPGEAGAVGNETKTASGRDTTGLLVTPTAPVLEVHVLGTPAPQGSKHARPIYKGRGANRVFTGKVAQVESSENLKPWREAVKHAALDVIAGREGTGDPFAIIGGAVYVETVFTFARPKGHYRTGRNAHLLRDDAPTWPTGKKNDIEKLDRGTRDALTDAGVWVDDGQVVHHESWKTYPGVHRDALPVPGAVIRIYLMGRTEPAVLPPSRKDV